MICRSYLGRIGGEQTISIGSGCLQTGVVIHEIMHALGYPHEHNRPDRDNYINIHWDNIQEGIKILRVITWKMLCA